MKRLKLNITSFMCAVFLNLYVFSISFVLIVVNQLSILLFHIFFLSDIFGLFSLNRMR